MTTPTGPAGPDATRVLAGLTGNYAVKSVVSPTVLGEFLSLVRELPPETAALVLNRFAEHVKNGNISFTGMDLDEAVEKINAAIADVRQKLSPGARASLSPLSRANDGERL